MSDLPGLVLAFVVTASAGALMISRFAFNSFKQVNAGAKVRFTYIVFVPLAFVFIFLHPPISLLLMFGLYALSAPSVWVFRKMRRRNRAAVTHMNSALRREYLAALGLTTWVARGKVVPVMLKAANKSWVAVESAALGPPAASGPPAAREAGVDWPELRARVAACTRCSLSATRTQTVFGVGNQQAEWLMVGEAPGAEEDRQGEPFVGRAGQLLNSMLRAVGLAREQVYIANVLEMPASRQSRPVRRRGHRVFTLSGTADCAH